MSSRYSSCFSFTWPNSFCFKTWEKPTIAFKRRAQLVAHVGQEVGLVLGGDLQRLGALGHAALEAGDQLLHALGHLVEGRGERSQLVLAIELDPLVVGAGADRLGRHLQALDRAHEPAREQDRERDRGGDEGGDQQGRLPDRSPRSGAKAALSGCSTNTFQPVEGDGRPGGEDLSLPAKLRPVAARRSSCRRLPAPGATWQGSRFRPGGHDASPRGSGSRAAVARRRRRRRSPLGRDRVSGDPLSKGVRDGRYCSQHDAAAVVARATMSSVVKPPSPGPPATAAGAAPHRRRRRSGRRARERRRRRPRTSAAAGRNATLLSLRARRGTAM